MVTAGLIALAIGIYILTGRPNLPSAQLASVHPGSSDGAPIAGGPSTGTNAASSMEAALTRLELRLAAQRDKRRSPRGGKQDSATADAGIVANLARTARLPRQNFPTAHHGPWPRRHPRQLDGPWQGRATG